jgi:predicted GNAT family acetyltransferase
VRPLAGADFDRWGQLNRAYLKGLGLVEKGTEAERRTEFERDVTAGHWWGLFQGAELLSTACLNARYRAVGQIGGVFTRPEYRGKGLASVVSAR